MADLVNAVQLLAGLAPGTPYTAVFSFLAEDDTLDVRLYAGGTASPAADDGLLRHTFTADVSPLLLVRSAGDGAISGLLLSVVELDSIDEPYLGPPFDGNSKPEHGRGYAWTGPADASESILFASDFTPGDQRWVLGTGESEGRVVGVEVWNGRSWVPYQLVADSILVPSSVGTILIGDGAITAPKVNAGSIWANEAWIDHARINVLTAGAIETWNLTVGVRPAQGETNQRVPAPLTDAEYWTKVIDGTIPLVPSHAGILLTTADAGGLTMTPTSVAFANVPVTSRMPVPASRKIHASAVSTEGVRMFARFFDAGGVMGTTSTVAGTLSGTIIDLPSTAVTYQVELRHLVGLASTIVTSARVFEVIGGGPGGAAYVEISPLGFRSVGEGGSQVVDLTANADNFLSLTKWNGVEYEAQTTFDKNGGGQLQRLAVNEDITVRGTALVGDFNSIYRNGALDEGPIIDRVARGILTHAYFDQGPETGITDAFRALAYFDFDIIDALRTYALAIDSNLSIVNNGTGTATIEVLLSSAPIPVDATSGYTILIRSTLSSTTPEIRNVIAMNRIMRAATSVGATQFRNGKNYILIRVRNTGGSSININASPARQIVGIYDLGPVGAGLLDVASSLTAGSGGGGGTPVAPPKPQTIQRVASWSRSYRNGGANPVTGSGAYDNANMLYRGLGNSAMGAIWGFPALGLAGKTILSAQMYLRNRHTSRNDGIAVNFEVHNLTSPPPTFGVGGGSWLVNWGRNVGAWVDLPAGWRAGFGSGAFRGIYMGVSGDGSNYGYWDGLGAEDAPQLRITYI